MDVVARLGSANVSARSRSRLNALVSLENEKAGPYALVVELKPILLPPARLFSGKTYFNIFMRDEEGRVSERPVIDRALYSVGGKGVLPWIEIGYYWDEVVLKEGRKNPETVRLADSEAEYRLFRLVGDLIPPGGHMMIPYELEDNRLSRMTLDALHKNVPMVATPLGFLLFSIGCTIPFRDWYIAEGGHEGPRKLHFEKPLSNARKKQVFGEILDELAAFVDGSREMDDEELMRQCQTNACDIRDRIMGKGPGSR